MPLIHPEKCELCEIAQKRVPHNGVAVPGSGNPKADIVLIGEAPGEQEAIKGIAFVGTAGQDLDKMLKLAGLERAEIYITNTCKCRPYKYEEDSEGISGIKNRAPNKNEIKNCRRFLQQELDIIQPKVLVPLGGVALAALEGKPSVKITERKGIPCMYQRTNIFMVPTWHPSYISRNGGVQTFDGGVTPLAQETVSHLQLAMKLAKGCITNPKKRYLVADNRASVEKIIAGIRKRRVVAFDIETTGLRIDDDILGIGFAVDVGVAAYIPFLTQDLFGCGLEDYWAEKDITKDEVLAKIKTVLEDPKIQTSAHNAKFDMRQLQKKWNICVNNLAWDTMCGSYLLNENGKHGLKDLKEKYIDLLGYEDDWNLATKNGKNSVNASLEIISMYCCGDCDATYRETKFQIKEFKKYPNLQKLMKKFYIPLMYLIKDIEYAGVLYNVPKAEPARLELENRAKILQKKIWDSVPNREAGEFNIGSTDEVAKVLYGVLGLQIDPNNKKIFETEKGKSKVDSDVLVYLSTQHPMPALITEYRHVEKMRTTYVERMLKEKDTYNRIHLPFNPIGTVTGRLSNKGLHNIPKDKPIKRLFCAPEGKKLVQADLSQAEVRCFAHYANEDILRNAFAVEGIDVHCLVAAEVNGFDVKDFIEKYKAKDPTCERLRQAAKGTTFGLLFGRGVASIATEYGIPLDEAEAFMRNFFKRFPNCKKWIDDTHKMVYDVGYVQNIFGRVRRLPAIYSKEKVMKEEAKRQAVNSIIQSTAADITNLAMIEINNRIKAQKIPAQIVLTVHDSIITEVDDAYVDQVAHMMVQVMERKPAAQFSVKLRADVDIYQEWGITLNKAA
jgi:DNA polymerase-1